ncbi:MAG: SRPBCC family protein [Actinobacteria bacterium]|nr:SRPBCC family protein [Actinomycetota bacterium]
MEFTRKITVNAPAEQVWAVFAHGFDDAHKWMASVPNSYGKENGTRFDGASSAGRVCQLQPDPSGLKASEQFLAYDESAKRCTVRIDFVDTPRVFPVRYNTVEFSVVDDAEGGSITTWGFSSKIKPWAFPMWPVIRLGAARFVTQIGEELAHYVETGSPHPRKVAASDGAEPRESA